MTMEHPKSKENLSDVCSHEDFLDDWAVGVSTTSLIGNRNPDVESIQRFDVLPSYSYIFENFLMKNVPFILGKSATNDWRSRRDWVTPEGKPDLKYLRENFDMTLTEYTQYWEKYTDAGHPPGMENLYLKDWHFTRDFPSYGAYRTPKYFTSDWLNEFWDVRSDVCDDYRFVYMGPKGSWTPFHADVFRSFSWSANICGRKKWIMFAPGEEANLKDKRGNLVFDVRSPELTDRARYPGYANIRKRFEVIQEAGEVIYVPSGWHHQVHNMEDTISINHNWINGCNLDLSWSFLTSNLCDVQREVGEFRDLDGWDLHCQVILKASSGIDFEEFFRFVSTIATKRLELLTKCQLVDSKEHCSGTNDDLVRPVEVPTTEGGATGNSDSANTTEGVSTGKSDSVNTTEGGTSRNSDSVNTTEGGVTGNSYSVNTTKGVATGNSDSVNTAEGGTTGNSYSVNITEGCTSGNGNSFNTTEGGTRNCDSVNKAESETRSNDTVNSIEISDCNKTTESCTTGNWLSLNATEGGVKTSYPVNTTGSGTINSDSVKTEDGVTNHSDVENCLQCCVEAAKNFVDISRNNIRENKKQNCVLSNTLSESCTGRDGYGDDEAFGTEDILIRPVDGRSKKGASIPTCCDSQSSACQLGREIVGNLDSNAGLVPCSRHSVLKRKNHILFDLQRLKYVLSAMVQNTEFSLIDFSEYSLSPDALLRTLTSVVEANASHNP